MSGNSQSATELAQLVSSFAAFPEFLRPDFLRAEAVRVFARSEIITTMSAASNGNTSWLDRLAGFSETLRSPRYDQLRRELEQCPFPPDRSSADTPGTAEEE
jgi:hypothetical protein